MRLLVSITASLEEWQIPPINQSISSKARNSRGIIKIGVPTRANVIVSMKSPKRSIVIGNAMRMRRCGDYIRIALNPFWSRMLSGKTAISNQNGYFSINLTQHGSEGSPSGIRT